MKELSDQRFFRLLSECSQKEFVVHDLTTVLQELANHLASIAIDEQDYALLLRYFSFKLNRLKSHRVQFEQGENTLLLLVDEAIEVINTEIRILNMRIKYPNQFQNRKNNFLPSPLYLTNETHFVEIIELVSGMFLSKRVVTHNGTESSLTEIGRTFEWLFNIKLGDIHKKHENVICRKVITEESQKKGYQQVHSQNY